MRKIKISFISNIAFVALFSAAAAYSVAIFYSRKIAPSTIIAISFSVAATCLYILIYRKKDFNVALKRQNENLLDKCRYALALSPENLYASDAERILKNNAINYEIYENEIFIEGKKIIFAFDYPNTNLGEFLKNLRSNNSPLIIAGIDFDDEVKVFAEPFKEKITLVDLYGLYPYIKNDEILLSRYEPPAKHKRKIKNFFKFTSNTKTNKKFAFYGLLLLITSKFVFYPAVYILFGCLFIAYALTTVFINLYGKSK